MRTILEVGSINYEDDKIMLIKALSHLQTHCSITDGYQISKPVSRFGWTFFKLWLKPNLILKINEEFSDMINKAKGRDKDEKFTNFMSDFFESRNCKVKLKLVEES